MYFVRQAVVVLVYLLSGYYSHVSSLSDVREHVQVLFSLASILSYATEFDELRVKSPALSAIRGHPISQAND